MQRIATRSFSYSDRMICGSLVKSAGVGEMYKEHGSVYKSGSC